MNLRSFFLILLPGLLCLQSFAQKRVLSGIVRIAGQPVEKLTVYTSFGSDVTDRLGNYSLDLSGCGNCRPGDRITIYTNHEQYGSNAIPCTITSDYRFDFSITRNPANVFITGIVKNSLDGQPLANIGVKIMSDIEMDFVKTNAIGQFVIPVHKSQTENMNAVRLWALDPAKNYRPVRNEPELYNINSFIIIQMEPSRAVSLGVNSYIKPNICFKKGDIITIEASGQMKVGNFVGSSGPDGKEVGWNLEMYNVVPQFNHAALMYKVSGDKEWRLAGKRRRFIASRDGCIEFDINDNTQGDNSGKYDVEVSIQAS